MRNTLKRLVASLLAAVIFTGLFAAPSFGWGQEGGAGGAGGGTGGSNPPSTTVPNPNGGSSGGGSGLPSNLITKRFVPNTGVGAGLCAFRDDGREAIGSDIVYRIEYAENTSGPENPPSGGGWVFIYATANGTYMFQRSTLVDFRCLYPSRTTTVVERCVIATSVDVRKEAPIHEVLGQQTSYSGWNAYSPDYQGCRASQSMAGEDRPLGIGYFESTMVHTYQNIVVEIATTLNDATGAYDAPKVVGYSPIYQSAPVFKSAHVACPDPTKIIEPGNRYEDFSMTRCSNQNKNNPAPLQQCVASSPLYSPPLPVPSGAKQNGQFGAAFPGTNFEMMRDGNASRLQFNQDITGANVSVDKYSTYFKRSGTPWLVGKSPNVNIFQLYANPLDTKTMLATESQTNELPGKVNTVYPALNDASDGGDAATVLTQVMKWSGTVNIQTAVAHFDFLTGNITTNGTTSMTIPTSGECQESVSLVGTKAKGDVIY